MPLDPSIALQVKPLDLSGGNRLQKLAQMEQLIGAQRANQMGAYQLQDAEQGQQANALMKQLMAENPGASMGELGAKVQQAGYIKQGQGLIKQANDAKKSSLDLRKTEGEITAQGLAAESAKITQGLQRFQAIGQLMAGVKDQPTYDVARQQAAGILGPEAAANMSPTYDPAAIEAARLKAMPIQEQMAQRQREITNKLEGERFGETKRHNQSTESVARGTLAARQAEVAMGGKPPPGYRWAEGGRLESIEGGPGDPRVKGVTEGQAKAGQFGSRMMTSNEGLAKLAAKGVNFGSFTKELAEGVPFVGGMLGQVANAVAASPEQQQFEQYARQFINAVLRRESGAAIGDSEFLNAYKQYFPQRGEDAATMEQKARAREAAAQGMLVEVPEAQRSQYIGAQPGAPAQRGAMPAQPGATPAGDPAADPLGMRGR